MLICSYLNEVMMQHDFGLISEPQAELKLQPIQSQRSLKLL